MGKSVTVETRKKNEHVELWGIRSNGRWWRDGNNVVFHTEHKLIASLQCEAVILTGLTDARVEQIQ